MRILIISFHFIFHYLFIYLFSIDDYVKQKVESSDEEDSLLTMSPQSMANSINSSGKEVSYLKRTPPITSTSSTSSKFSLFDDKDEMVTTPTIPNNNNSSNSSNSNSSSSKSTSGNKNITNNNNNEIKDVSLIQVLESSSGSDSDDPIHSVATFANRARTAGTTHMRAVGSGSSSNASSASSTPVPTPILGALDDLDSDEDKSHFTETLRFTMTTRQTAYVDEDSGRRKKGKKHRAGEPKNMGLEFNYGMEKEGDKWLVGITISYTIITQLIGFCLILFFSKVDKNLDSAISEHSSNRVFWSFFMAVTSFTNLGYNYWCDGLDNHNLSKCPGLVLTMSILIVSGNTCIPIFVRFWVWMCRNLSSQRNKPKYLQSLRGILKNITFKLYTYLFIHLFRNS